jgi:hypothetical protein
MIEIDPKLIALLLERNLKPRGCYVYELRDKGVPFYVGSTNNPAARWYEHRYCQATKASAPYIASMTAAGREPVLRVIDLTNEASRYHVEAFWINATSSAVNCGSMLAQYNEYLRSPERYASLRSGNYALRGGSKPPTVRPTVAPTAAVAERSAADPFKPATAATQRTITVEGVTVTVVSDDIELAVLRVETEIRKTPERKRYRLSGTTLYR